MATDETRDAAPAPAPVLATVTRMNDASRRTLPVLGVAIDALACGGAIDRIRGWACSGESRYVCVCNAHSLVTATQDAAFADALQRADMATPDGAPVAWMMRRLGQHGQGRISGPDLMWRYCAAVAGSDEGIFLYGATPQTLDLLEQALRLAFPGLRICGKRSPPFRALTADEEQQDVDLINASGAGVVWVSLGCPKQELWMARQVGRIQAVMVGVGAAFDFHAGQINRAPMWMQRSGLEWLQRLASEPRRLWRRYLVTNSCFIAGAAGQLANRWWRRKGATRQR